MNQALALLVILGGVLLASRLNAATSTGSPAAAGPGRGENGGATGFLPGAAGVLAVAGRVVSQVQQAANVGRVVQSWLPSPDLPVEALDVSQVFGELNIPLPGSELYQVAAEYFTTPIPALIEPGMTIGVDVGAFPTTGVIGAALGPLADIGAEALPVLSISQVVGEEALAAVGETGFILAPEGFGAIAPALSVVGGLALIAAPILAVWAAGGFEPSDWSDELPAARAAYREGADIIVRQYGGDWRRAFADAQATRYPGWIVFRGPGYNVLEKLRYALMVQQGLLAIGAADPGFVWLPGMQEALAAELERTTQEYDAAQAASLQQRIDEFGTPWGGDTGR